MNEPVRPLYWSLRRELWENRVIYVVPMLAAAFMLMTFTFSVVGLPHRHHRIDAAYKTSAAMLIVTGIAVGIFYSADALYGERRDRSILFWKSLPVSDLTTVLSKAATPLVVIPLVTFGIILATHVFMLELSTAVLVTHGYDPTLAWNGVNPLILMSSLAGMSLWYAPVYAYFILISAWARRLPFVWALMPLIVIDVLEGIVFGSQHFGAMLRERLMGFKHYDLTPDRFLADPDLWIGLMFAAIFIAAAVRLRRNREPI